MRALAAVVVAGCPVRPVAAAVASDTLHCYVSPAQRRQTVEGWGVSLCWWANMCGRWSDDRIESLVKLLVDPNGLNYNVFRYNIGGGDDPENRNCTPHHMGGEGGKGLRAEMEGFKVYEESDYDWTRDAAQRKIMLKIKEMRPDAVFEAFSNSAPWWMTWSGCCGGNKQGGQDNLRPEYYEAFARYLVDVCKHYKETYGIEFRTLDPFNEPYSSYWTCSGSQEGCHFSPASQVKFLKVLYPMLQASGLKTMLSAPDESALTDALNTLNTYAAYPEVFSMLGQWNSHTYYGDNRHRAQVSALVGERGLPLWMSETGEGGEGIGGNLAMAQRLMDDMRYLHPTVWCDWQYVEEQNDQWDLVRADFATQQYERVKNYYVRQQVTRFIKQGYTMLNVLNDQTLAAMNPSNDTLVIVHLNNTGKEARYAYDLSAFDEVADYARSYATSETENLKLKGSLRIRNKQLAVRLPARSIQTYIIKVKTDGKATVNRPVGGKTYLLSPRIGSFVVTERDGKAVLADYASADDGQFWRLEEKGGAYSLQNRQGRYLTATDGYLLSLSDTPGEGQEFVFTELDNGYFKITDRRTGKAFDLQNESCSDGTPLGVWDYGTSAKNVHRQWAICPVAEHDMTDAVKRPDAEDVPSGVKVLPDEGGMTVINPSGDRIRLHVYTPDGQSVVSRTLTGYISRVELRKGFYMAETRGESGRQVQKIRIR